MAQDQGEWGELAERIRTYVRRKYIEPARAAGRSEVEIRAGDVYQRMGLRARMPAVCSALGPKFEQASGVALIHRSGPAQGANVYFRFRLDPAPVDSGDKFPAQKLSPNTEGMRNAPRGRSPVPGAPIGRSDTVYLVSCVSAKRPTAAPAKDLYTSDWFLKARNHVEGTGARWFILSAEYGLLSPDEVVAPFERTLNTMPSAARHQWAERVMAQLSVALPTVRHVTFLAGARYREFLAELLLQEGISIDVPMEGLRIGEQLQWLSCN